MYKSSLEPVVAIRHLNEEIEKLENKSTIRLYKDDINFNHLKIQALKERIKLYL
jgi:hypothetical protein